MKNNREIDITPKLPLISIYNQKGLEIITEENLFYLKTASAYELIKGQDNNPLFDSEGNVWNIKKESDKFKNTLINRFLAKSFYNPRFPIQLSWIKMDNYLITDLKANVINCIKNDDDYLTQFVPCEFLIEKVNISNSFNEIIEILDFYCFKVKDEQFIFDELDKSGFKE